MKNKIFILSILAFLFLILALNSAEAIIVKSVNADTIYPGQEGSITITLKNDASSDIEDVSIVLDFSNLPLSPVESSEENTDEILEGKTKTFTFHVRANNDAVPGSYNIPYIITYDGLQNPKKGSIGITVSGKVNLEYTAIQENNVIGNKGKINLKIINKGTADAKFVDVKITPEGFTLLSESYVYVGTISSDDFETASFDVIYDKKISVLNAVITYKDFDNTEKKEVLELPLKVYTKEEALKLGIIKTNKIGIYISIIVILIIIWFFIRRKNKLRRIKRNELMMR